MPPQLRQLHCGRRWGFGYVKIGLTTKARRRGTDSDSAAETTDQESPVNAVPIKPSPPASAKNSRRVVPCFAGLGA
jgi:hypothetical protein